MAPPSATDDFTSNGVSSTANGTSSPSHQSQEAAAQKAKVKMSFPKPPVFEDKYEEREYLKGRLAAAFRIFGEYGFDEGVAGHITLRDPVDPTTFWVNPFGVAFSQIKRSDLIQVDHDGNIIAGGPCRLLNAAAYMIHSAIHAARPDVNCAAHSHSIYGRAFCALGRPLDIITQDSCAFYNVSSPRRLSISYFLSAPLSGFSLCERRLMSTTQDHVVYKQFNGVVLAEEEGKNIAKALGNKKAALLQNHGLLTVGRTVEEAIFWFISLEKCCHAQLMADAAFTYKTVGTPGAGWFSAKPLFDVIHQETNGDYLN